MTVRAKSQSCKLILGQLTNGLYLDSNASTILQRGHGGDNLSITRPPQKHIKHRRFPFGSNDVQLANCELSGIVLLKHLHFHSRKDHSAFIYGLFNQQILPTRHMILPLGFTSTSVISPLLLTSHVTMPSCSIHIGMATTLVNGFTQCGYVWHSMYIMAFSYTSMYKSDHFSDLARFSVGLALTATFLISAS